MSKLNKRTLIPIDLYGRYDSFEPITVTQIWCCFLDARTNMLGSARKSGSSSLPKEGIHYLKMEAEGGLTKEHTDPFESRELRVEARVRRGLVSISGNWYFEIDSYRLFDLDTVSDPHALWHIPNDIGINGFTVASIQARQKDSANGDRIVNQSSIHSLNQRLNQANPIADSWFFGL